MAEKVINGIQQIGVGVNDVVKAYNWYAKHLDANVMIFDDPNEATYMAPYMGNKPRQKRAILSLNMNGGSGFELWQHTEHTPTFPNFEIQKGDLGINYAKIKVKDAEHTRAEFIQEGVDVTSEIFNDLDGGKAFTFNDLFGNPYQAKETADFFKNKPQAVGGVFGAAIGVSDIDEALKLYSNVLGYSKTLADETNEDCRRILITHPDKKTGGFAKVFGNSEIELIQCLKRTPRKIYEGRFWGDPGFIHLCFDIVDMQALEKECADKGFPFKVRSSDSFDMGGSNGNWAYTEDPDGTLIEFVETLKVPIIKPLGWNLDLTKRDPRAPLPNWLINALSLKKKKSIQS